MSDACCHPLVVCDNDHCNMRSAHGVTVGMREACIKRPKRTLRMCSQVRQACACWCLLLVVAHRWLNNKDLTGTLPTELGLMTSLTALCAHPFFFLMVGLACTCT